MKNAAADFSVQRNGDTVSVAGTLTIATAPAALAAAADLFNGENREVYIYLADLQHVDSAALAVLLEWRRRAAERGKQLSFVEVPERLRQLAQISELDAVLGFSAAA